MTERGSRDTVWRLGEHVPDDQTEHAPGEATCLVCGERWPCEQYRTLMEYAEVGAAGAGLPTAEQQERAKSGLEPIGLLRDLSSPEWHDCTCDAHEAARYWLAWFDKRPDQA